MALEAQDQGFNCGECNERLRQERDCGRFEQSKGDRAVHRFSSPLLHDDGKDKVYECPIGIIMRESPYTYDLLNQRVYIEAGGVGPSNVPRCTQRAMSIASSEQARLREHKRSVQAGVRSSKAGVQAVKRRR